jgi:hypothetical protein
MEASKPDSSQVRTGNLVLKTRVGVLIRNLEEVQRALEAVKRRRANLRQLLGAPAQFGESIDSLKRWLKVAADGYEAGDWGQVATGLDNIDTGLSTLDDQVTVLSEPVENLQGAALLQDEVAKTDEVAKAVHESLEKEIRATFGEELAGLESLLVAIAGAAKREAAREDESATEAMEESWAEYTNELYENSERLFAEYVELVGGVAIRDAGFDRGICRIAEDLLKPVGKIGNFTWNNLTIPARHEALAVTASRIVRLGFPEWTIWTLPLTAHELANDFADLDRDIASYVTKHGGDRKELLVLLADAFATYFMGPAYACAAILMRFNPAAAFLGDRLIAKRVAVIFSVLRRMSTEERKREDLYEPITTRLSLEWEDALRQTGWTGSMTSAGDSRATQGRSMGWLSPEDQAAIQRCTGLTDDEQMEVHRLLEGFEPFVWSKRLNINAWPMVEDWANELNARRTVNVGELDEFDELRYVLNAAWRARIAVRREESDTDDPADLRRMADAIEKLLWALVAGPEGKQGSDGAQQRPALQRTRRTDQAAQPGPPQSGAT